MSTLQNSTSIFKSPSGRDGILKNGYSFLEGRRKDDGAEGLWRIGNKLYDLQSFIRSHPGGAEWLEITRGTDITEAFEVHHISKNAEKLLPKFFVREAKQPRCLPFTFEPDGFYRKFKERAYLALKDVNFHSPCPKSKAIADLICVTLIVSAILATAWKSWIAVVVSGVFMAWTAIVAHNFFHMKDNYRMYYFDMCLGSSKEWRISHVLSHHMYPNTSWDMEVYLVEPFIQFLPHKSKNIFHKLLSVVSSPIVWTLSFPVQGIKRYYSALLQWKSLEFRDAIPFFLPTLMVLVGPSPYEALKTFLIICLLSSFLFHFIGFSAAHHHPDIFHEGDVMRKDMDFGLMELDAVRDREVIDDSIWLVLTNFGSHGLHHLLPVVDHGYLPLCVPAFIETCNEFGIENIKFSQWELIKGQFRQVVRNEPKLNYRGSDKLENGKQA